MRFLKSLIRGLASLGFKLGLVFLALVSAIIMVFGTPAAIKQALHSSKIYDNIVDNVITTAKQDGENKDQNGSLSIDDPQIKQAANTAFSPAVIQSSTEQVIDSTYKWLQSKTPKPDFRIDLSDVKLRFAQAAADNAAARARLLPPCSLQQVRELAMSGDIDPFSMPCLPPGTDITTVRNKVISDLANNQDILKETVITADNLPKDEHGKTALDNLNRVPKIFHWLMLAPWIIGGLTLVCGVLLIFLYDEIRRGLRAIGVILLGSGIFLLIGTWVFSYVLNQANKPGGRLSKLSNNGLQTNFIEILRSLNTAISHKLITFAAVYIGLGAITLLALHFTKPKTESSGPKPSTKDQPETSVNQPKETPEPATNAPKQEK